MAKTSWVAEKGGTTHLDSLAKPHVISEQDPAIVLQPKEHALLLEPAIVNVPTL